MASNRLGEVNKDSKVAKLQNLDMIEGPTSNVSTVNFSINKPSKVRGWQVAFRVNGLEEIKKLPVRSVGTRSSPEVVKKMEGVRVPTKDF